MANNYRSCKASDSENLTEIFKSDDNQDQIWMKEDLEALCRHQLSAPVGFDMSALHSKGFERIQHLASAQGLLLNSYQDLFKHPRAPLKLLIMVKDYAKYCLNSPDGVLPNELYHLLYYASIAVARLRHGREISKLSDEKLQHGLEWAAKRDWLDDGMRDLFIECLGYLALEEKNHE